MNLKQIEAFVKVANNRSFSQTAKELYLTQPTISAHISALEEELGVQLFVRTTKGVRVTEEGKKLYLYARQMTELEENIKTLFQKRGEDGVLSAGSHCRIHHPCAVSGTEDPCRIQQALFECAVSGDGDRFGRGDRGGAESYH